MFRQIRHLSGGGLIPSRISPAEYAERRSRLDQLLVKTFPNKEYVVLVKGAETSFTAPDVPHAFRQCSHFTYLTGVRVPGCSYLVHKTAGGRTRRILFMERRSEYQQLWEGALPKDEELEKTAGFDELLSPKELQEVLSKMASPQSNFFFQDTRWKNTAIHPIRSEFASINNVVEYIEKLRVVKSGTEVEAMRDVCGIGAQMMNSAMASSKGYVSENAVVGLLEFEARRRGAECLAYPPVVAAGNRANTIHYLEANKSMDMGECLLVDAGCDLNGYVSDITRCWPISGEFSPVQRRVYEHLRIAHVQLLDFANSTEKLRLSTIYRQMIDLLAVCMTEAGVIPRTASDTEKIAMAEKLCPHHVSHYLGMDVHDCASVSRDIDLEPGVAFTIEPGVYIPNDSSFAKEFRGIGFRIEDDVVTRHDGGIEILTDAVPRTAQEIEYLMNPM